MDGRRDFHHPYKPYDIQYELMSAIYDCISNEQVGIFESPTGTGKSLSLICGSLAWLRDNLGENNRRPNDLDLPVDGDEPSWVIEHAQRSKDAVAREQKIRTEKRLNGLRKREKLKASGTDRMAPVKKLKRTEGRRATESDDDNFELDEYHSEDEAPSTRRRGRDDEGPMSAATLKLMERLGETPYRPSKDESEEDSDQVKIFYCTRTHSQLTQFVQELRRIRLPTPGWMVEALEGSSQDPYTLEVKHVPLASRKNLCINDTVLGLGSVSAINERCLELQDPKTSKEHKCPFIPNKDDESVLEDFKDHTLAQIRDIEEIGLLGRRLGICPYYASRNATKTSEVISLPYQLLLQKSAREALGFSLKGHVVIIDEAHNLADTIANMSSVTLTHHQLKASRAQLGFYLQKFGTMLKGKNRIYVVQTVRVIESLTAYITQIEKKGITDEGIASVDDMMAGKGMDQVNLHKLLKYLQESKLARKIHGYQGQLSEMQTTPQQKHETPTAPVLNAVQAFLEIVLNPATEGRFFCMKSDSAEWTLKYRLLDPSPPFRDVVEEARAIILAGGTMSPMDDYKKQLLSYLEPDRLITWSCGHIIPKGNLVVRTITKGPDGMSLDFAFQKRQDAVMIASLGHSLLQLSSVIPDGLVVFFPSYSYLDVVVSAWKAPAPRRIWDRLMAKKPIFQESKEFQNVEDMLREYSISVDTNRGGLLLSVMGGKLSEGINFSDRLGRGVAVVGLPFPDARAAPWKAKMEYLERKTAQDGGSMSAGKAEAQDFYVNSCMRTVNQSIGRAIRHKDDYAAIILLDRRYDTHRIAEKLPEWIKQGVVKGDGEAPFLQKMDGLKVFFAAKAST